MKNIFLLPTDKPTRLYYHKNNLVFSKGNFSGEEGVNLYIVSNEEIKKGNWCLPFYNGILDTVTSQQDIYKVKNGDFYCEDKKIILTTDPKLIKDGVQEVGDDFLQWLIENPTRDRIETAILVDNVYVGGFLATSTPYGYRVFIPVKQEEHRTGSLSECVKSIIDKQLVEINNLQQETLEDAAELDCPFKFTSRCTIGRCDCKPKAHENLDNGQSKRRIYGRKEMIEFGKKCAEFGYENSLDNEGQLTEEWINDNL